MTSVGLTSFVLPVNISDKIYHFKLLDTYDWLADISSLLHRCYSVNMSIKARQIQKYIENLEDGWWGTSTSNWLWVISRKSHLCCICLSYLDVYMMHIINVQMIQKIVFSARVPPETRKIKLCFHGSVSSQDSCSSSLFPCTFPSIFSSAFAVLPFPPLQVCAATARFYSKWLTQLRKKIQFWFSTLVFNWFRGVRKCREERKTGHMSWLKWRKKRKIKEGSRMRERRTKTRKREGAGFRKKEQYFLFCPQ